jgi:hypothetical protein
MIAMEIAKQLLEQKARQKIALKEPDLMRPAVETPEQAYAHHSGARKELLERAPTTS